MRFLDFLLDKFKTKTFFFILLFVAVSCGVDSYKKENNLWSDVFYPCVSWEDRVSVVPIWTGKSMIFTSHVNSVCTIHSTQPHIKNGNTLYRLVETSE